MDNLIQKINEVIIESRKELRESHRQEGSALNTMAEIGERQDELKNVLEQNLQDRDRINSLIDNISELEKQAARQLGIYEPGMITPADSLRQELRSQRDLD